MRVSDNQSGVPEGRLRVLVGLDNHAVLIDPHCQFCLEMAEGGSWFFPRHDGSSLCESGGRPHCTCDRCF